MKDGGPNLGLTNIIYEAHWAVGDKQAVVHSGVCNLVTND